MHIHISKSRQGYRIYQKPTRLTDGATAQNIYKMHADEAAITNGTIQTHLYRSRHTHPQIRLQTSKQTKRIIWRNRAPPYPWTNIDICNERIYIPKCRLWNEKSTPNGRRGCPKWVDHQTVRLYLRAWNAAPEERGSVRNMYWVCKAEHTGNKSEA